MKNILTIMMFAFISLFACAPAFTQVGLCEKGEEFVECAEADRPVQELGFAQKTLDAVWTKLTRPENWKSPVQKYGWLSVGKNPNKPGTKTLLDQRGNPVQLRGISYHGIKNGNVIEFLGPEAMDAFVFGWGAEVIRLPMYITEWGYAENIERDLTTLEIAIERAINRGVYVMIDWHILGCDKDGSNSNGHPLCPAYTKAGLQKTREEWVDGKRLLHFEEPADIPQFRKIIAAHPEYNGPEVFFAYMADKYGRNPHVMYELANEPNGILEIYTEKKNITRDHGNNKEYLKLLEDSWKSELLPYFQSVSDVIRLHSPTKNVIICGSDNFSQRPDQALKNPVKGENIMYSVHIYAGSHDTADMPSDWAPLTPRLIAAAEGGLAVFVTEFSPGGADGDGKIDKPNADRFSRIFNEYNMSGVIWSVTNKKEATACLADFATSNPPKEWVPTGRLMPDGQPEKMYVYDYPEWSCNESGVYARRWVTKQDEVTKAMQGEAQKAALEKKMGALQSKIKIN